MHGTCVPPNINYFNELYACIKGFWLIVVIQGGEEIHYCAFNYSKVKQKTYEKLMELKIRQNEDVILLDEII